MVSHQKLKFAVKFAVKFNHVNCSISRNWRLARVLVARFIRAGIKVTGIVLISPSLPSDGGEGRREEELNADAPLSGSLPTHSSRGERVNCRGIPTVAFDYALASSVHFLSARFKLRT